MSEMELYDLWCENAKEDPDLRAELDGIRGDSEAINDRFYRDLNSVQAVSEASSAQEPTE